MNTKTITAGLIGGIAAFLLGWVVFGIALKGFYDSNITVYPGLMKTEPTGSDLGLLFLSNLCWSYLLAHIFNKWANVNSFGTGAQAGFVIGLLVAASFDLFIHAFMNLYSTTLVIVDIIMSGVMAAIIGGIIGWYLGRGNTQAA